MENRASANDAIASIDCRFATAPCCPHCKSVDAGTWSKPKPLARCMCHACGRTFTALTGTPLERLRRRDAWLAYGQAPDDGWSCERVAQALYLDDDTVRSWRKLHEERGIAGLEQFEAGGSSSRLSAEQETELKEYVARTLPRNTREIGAFIERKFEIVHEGRSGLIALLHRLGLEYHKPEVIGRKLDAEKQRAFMEGYELTLGVYANAILCASLSASRQAPHRNRRRIRAPRTMRRFQRDGVSRCKGLSEY